ncbi:MAG: hypothetical protein JXQ73_15985 [Phycisphaerae bacterium]|nr:hypothetical protein [Phycisphaerae bacterium]
MLTPVVEWKKLKTNKRFKIAAVAVGSLLCLTGVGAGAYCLWPEPAPKPPPPIETSSLDENADYAASEDFNRLPMKKRLEWVEAQMRKMEGMDEKEFVDYMNSMDDAKRRRIQDNMREVMRARIKNHVDEYSKLSGEARTAYLDERIDEMRQWEHRARRSFGPRSDATRPVPEGVDPKVVAEKRRNERRAHAVADVKRFMTDESADQRKKTLDFFSAVQARRSERGLGRLFGRRSGSR